MSGLSILSYYVIIRCSEYQWFRRKTLIYDVSCGKWGTKQTTPSHSGLRTNNKIINYWMWTSSSTSAKSLLNILRAPKPSDLTRKRKLQCSPEKAYSNGLIYTVFNWTVY